MTRFLSASQPRTLSSVLIVHLLLLVAQVFAFSWHGAYKSAPASRRDTYPGWQPETFWWRNRRRNMNPALRADASVQITPGQADQNQESSKSLVHAGSAMSREGLQELNNHIHNMPQPASPRPGLKSGKVGWGFLRPLNKHGNPTGQQQSHSTHYVSFHYSTPAFKGNGLGSMNRRDKQDNRIWNFGMDSDKEVMNNMISQVLEHQQHHRPVFEMLDSPIKSEPVEPSKLGEIETITPAPKEKEQPSLPLAPTHFALKTIVRPTARSSSALESSQHGFFGHSSGFHEPVPALDSFNDFSGHADMGFGSFVDPGNSPGHPSGSFGEPVMFDVQPSGSQGGEGGASQRGTKKPHGHSTDGFGDFAAADTDVGQFGWREPSSFSDGGGFSGEIKPIPSAASAPFDSFSKEDKDCDTILTKSCADDSECQCYGFFYCGAGKCRDVTASSPNKGAVTVGGKWHDGPAEKLGLSRRR